MSSSALQIGSSVVPLYVERQMKVYAVTESEFVSLSTLNTQTTVFFSVGMWFLGTVISIWANAVFYTETPPVAVLAKTWGAGAAVIIAVVFFGLALHAMSRRSSTWKAIKNESSSRASA
jgi:hypothetical protein